MYNAIWFLPALEVLHYLGIILWVGAVAVLDFRLIGLAKDVPLYRFYIGPTALVGAALVLITGFLMYFGMPASYGSNPAFQIKIVLLIAATATAFIFHSRHIRTDGGGGGAVTSPGARMAGALSLVLWFGVLIAGRLVAYLGPAQG